MDDGRGMGLGHMVALSGVSQEKVCSKDQSSVTCVPILKGDQRKGCNVESEEGLQTYEFVTGLRSGGMLDVGGVEMEGVELDTKGLGSNAGLDIIVSSKNSPTNEGRRRWKRAARKGSSPKLPLGVLSPIQRMLEEAR
ncbi:hypothetical protein ACOSP7_022676 [Xanthoceras sorbifolium]